MSENGSERERERARKQRIKELEVLASKETQTWQKVVDLIELKQAKPYDEATALLKDLRDLAVDRGRLPEFNDRFEKIKSDYIAILFESLDLWYNNTE